jgi:hypothetical protein
MAFPDSTRRIVEEIAALIPAPLSVEEEPTPLEANPA